MIAPPALVAYATALAGHPVGVVCAREQSFPPGELGFVVWTPDPVTGAFVGFTDQRIYLPTSECRRIVVLLRREFPKRVVAASVVQDEDVAGHPIDVGDGDAVDALLHEAFHLRLSSTDEADVECQSWQNRWLAVSYLRLPAWRARMLLRGITNAHRWSLPSYLTEC